MLRYALPLALFVALIAFLAVGLTRDPTTVPSPLVGKRAPSFALPELRDPARTLTPADFAGKVVLLNVWGTWCVSCRQEHPLLVDLSRRKLVDIYGLNWKDDRAAAIRWLDQLGDPYVASGVDSAGNTAIDYGVYGAPETFVIDRRGVVAYKHIGPITPEVWRDTLEPLIRRLRDAPG